MPAYALVRQVSASFAAALRRDLSQDAPDLALARQEHAAYCRALQEIGLGVRILPPLDDSADACFVEDRVLSFGTRVLLSHSAVKSRRPETQSLLDALEPDYMCTRMSRTSGACLDGGDVIRLGTRAWVALSERTNELGIACLREWLEASGCSLQALPEVSDLHLKCSASALGPNAILCASSWPYERYLPSDVEVVRIPDAESYAANVVAYGGAVIMASGYPESAALVAASGRRVVLVDVSAFRAADGALTCLSVLFENE